MSDLDFFLSEEDIRNSERDAYANWPDGLIALKIVETAYAVDEKLNEETAEIRKYLKLTLEALDGPAAGTRHTERLRTIGWRLNKHKPGQSPGDIGIREIGQRAKYIGLKEVTDSQQFLGKTFLARVSHYNIPGKTRVNAAGVEEAIPYMRLTPCGFYPPRTEEAQLELLQPAAGPGPAYAYPATPGTQAVAPSFAPPTVPVPRATPPAPAPLPVMQRPGIAATPAQKPSWMR